MFNGIIYNNAKVEKISGGKKSSEITLKTNLFFKNTEVGSSLCCNGTCLTITNVKKNLISFYLSKETLNKTNFNSIKIGNVINIEKSRFVKEKSKIPISVSWDGGVETYSGLLDVAMAGGYVVKPSNGWYSTVDMSTGEISEKKVRQSGTLTKDFWDPIFTNTNFKEFVKNQFTIGYKSEVDMDTILETEVG